MKFGVSSAVRAAHSMIQSFPFPPPVQWRTLMPLLSMNRRSGASPGSRQSAADAPQIPRSKKSVDLPALAAAFSENVVAVEPSGLAYGGTTTSRDALFENVFGYLLQRASFQLESSEVLGSGGRLAGHFTATLTALGSGECIALDQVELYDVIDGVITKVRVFQNNTPALIAFFDRNGPTS